MANGCALKATGLSARPRGKAAPFRPSNRFTCCTGGRLAMSFRSCSNRAPLRLRATQPAKARVMARASPSAAGQVLSAATRCKNSSSRPAKPLINPSRTKLSPLCCITNVRRTGSVPGASMAGRLMINCRITALSFSCTRTLRAGCRARRANVSVSVLPKFPVKASATRRAAMRTRGCSSFKAAATVLASNPAVPSSAQRACCRARWLLPVAATLRSTAPASGSLRSTSNRWAVLRNQPLGDSK